MNVMSMPLRIQTHTHIYTYIIYSMENKKQRTVQGSVLKFTVRQND